MDKRMIAALLGAAALAVPSVAAAHSPNDDKGGDRPAKVENKTAKDAEKQAKRDAKAKKLKTYSFKGVYAGNGVVEITRGNKRVRQAGFVGKKVTFDFSGAKIRVAETDGKPGITLDDVKTGDRVEVQARLPRKLTAIPATIVARKIEDRTNPATGVGEDNPNRQGGPVEDNPKPGKVDDNPKP